MAVNYSKNELDIVRLELEHPEHPSNVLNSVFFDAFEKALERIESESSVKGIILISAKPNIWVAGGDIDASFGDFEADYFFKMIQDIKQHFRRLETIGVPVVAALNGTAMGGGFELALATHHRIAINSTKIKFGFPEVGLGLLPGAGGIVRTGRLAGLQTALEWLTQNKKYSPEQALEAGLIDALAENESDLISKAETWILNNPDAKAPWDAVKRYKIPGGGPNHPKVAQMLVIAPAMIRKETKGNFPAPQAILSALAEGAQVDFDTACRIESRYFAKLAAGQVSKNMINAFWTQLNQIKKGASRPQQVPQQVTKKLGVLGSGMMGHGIAYVSALNGLEVVMTDASQAGADAGKEKIADLLSKQLKRGKMSQDKIDTVLQNITATDDYEQLEGCDLIIEAVFEDSELKAQVTKVAEAAMDSTGIFASNTSSIPITNLAKASQRPEQFIGLHFFSPVYKMKLVEIIVGEKTSDEALAKAFDYVLAIGKVPIVVNDSRGFYTSRVFGTWTNEGLALLAEGNHPQAIEMAGLQAGMPIGPLALADELSLTLMQHIRDQTIKDLKAEGKPYLVHPGDSVPDTMVDLGRAGRANGAGFYDYKGRSKQLWPELQTVFKKGHTQLSQDEMIDRILFAQSIESARCMEEGVLRLSADANLGSIFGWGYAAHNGGTLQFINAYGVSEFVVRADELSELYGERFTPPQLLRDMAEQGKSF